MPSIVQEIIHNSYTDDPIKIFVGDADEFFMDAYDGEARHFVWVNYRIDENTVQEKAVGKFDTMDEAEAFATTLQADFTKYGLAAKII